MTTAETTSEITDRTIALPDGTSLHVNEFGAGEPLVLICGTTQPQQLWAPLLPALSAHRVITYDHRGIGNSTRGDGEISMASLADDLAALLGELGLDRAHVLGWSLGSTVALELALRHPWRTGHRAAPSRIGARCPVPGSSCSPAPPRARPSCSNGRTSLPSSSWTS